MRQLSEIKRIHIISYCHQDHAWTNTRRWHIRRYLAFYAAALDLMNRNPDYRITIDNIVHGLAAFEQYMPSRMEELRQRAREGRIHVANGGAALTRPSNCGDELYLRNLIKGRRAFEYHFGNAAQSRVFLNADTGMGHSQLPQILCLAGYGLYRFFRPLGVLDAQGVPREFAYVGLDGSRILISRGIYDTSLAFTYPKEQTTDAMRAKFLEEEIAPKLPLHESEDLLLFVGGDDAQPLRNSRDEDLHIEVLIDGFRGQDGPEVFFSSMDEYLRQLERQRLPVLTGIIEPCDLAYNLPVRGDNSLWRNRFLADRRIIRLERLGVLLEALGGLFAFSLTEALWDRLIGYSGHAFEWLLEEDYLKALDLARATVSEADRLTDDVVEEICARVGSGENSYLLINPNGFPVRQVVTVPVSSARNLNGFRIEDDQGRPIPFQFLWVNEGDKGFAQAFTEAHVACEVEMPALSATCVRLIEENRGRQAAIEQACEDLPELCDFAAPEAPGCLVLDNGVVRLRIERGAIRDVCVDDKPVYTGNKSGFCRFLRYQTTPREDWLANCDDIAVEEFVPETCRCPSRGPLVYRYESDGRIGQDRARIAIELRRGEPKIDFQLELLSGGFEGYLNASIPVDERGGLFAGIPFGAEPRDLSSTVYSEDLGIDDTNYIYFERDIKGLFFAKHFASFCCNGVPTAILQGDSGIYCRQLIAPGRVELFLMRGLRSDVRKERWVRAIGRSLSGQGVQHFAFSVAFPERADDFAQLHALAQRIEQPVIAAPVFHVGERGKADLASAISIDAPQVLLTAAYRQGEAYLIRAFNATSEPVDAQIRLRLDIRSVVRVNLLDEELETLTMDALGEVRLRFGGHQIVTLRAERMAR